MDERYYSDFVSKLNRDHMGSIAVPVEALSAMDLLQRHVMGSSAYYQEMGAHPFKLGSDPDDATLDVEGYLDDVLADHGFVYDDALAELFYWWSLYGDTAVNEYINRGNRDEGYLGERTRKVALANEYPEMVPYFLVGIWDVSEITGYMEVDIDPNLAVSLGGVSDV